MNEPILMAQVRREEATGQLLVLAPKIGWWIEPPHRGALLGPGSSIGRLQQLNRRYRLVLPDAVAGRVAAGVRTHRVSAVEHGQLLFTLIPLANAADLAQDIAAFAGPGVPDLPDGARAIVSPTDGVFYRSPSPDAPPFVSVGDRIRRGQAVGLVEVMKTFNEILYGGPGLPEAVEVLEVRVDTAREVRSGEILVIVREPAGPAGGNASSAAGASEV